MQHRKTKSLLILAVSWMAVTAYPGGEALGGEPAARPESRQDQVLGYQDEGLTFGREEGTGDTVLRIERRPPVPTTPGQNIPMVVPEVDWPAPSNAKPPVYYRPPSKVGE